MFALSSGEGRRWNAIQKLAESGDDRDLGLLLDRLQDYLRRYENGPHAEKARSMLPDVERERRRREFVRSPLVGQLRPSPESPSELERLYRKSLLQLWTEGDAAARATLESIISREEVDEQNRFLVRLAEEDLLSLKLREAESLYSEGKYSRARDLLTEIVDKHSGNIRLKRWVNLAKQDLDRLHATHADPPPQE